MANDPYHLILQELFPICRSMTGDGVRKTLQIIGNRVPLQVTEVATGTKFFDWEIPPEWTIRDAWIKSPDGRKLVDFSNSNLHVVNGSRPVHEKLELQQLIPHLHTLPRHPDWIPYRTAFFQDSWGFCLQHATLQSMLSGGERSTYEVCIDSERKHGTLTYGEVVLPGHVEDCIVFSTHVCHPSMANDNLSGIVVAMALAEHLVTAPRRYSYRIVFCPATIGPLAWLSNNRSLCPLIRHGLVLALLGHGEKFTYKKSRQGNAAIDRLMAGLVTRSDSGGNVLDFSPIGYDERQYGSPGFNLPFGCLMRYPPGHYAEYHTSADDLGLISPRHLDESLELLKRVVAHFESEEVYQNTSPFGEPCLGRHGLYEPHGMPTRSAEMQEAILWVLNQSDGTQSLYSIAEAAGRDVSVIRQAASLLLNAQLIRPVQEVFSP